MLRLKRPTTALPLLLPVLLLLAGLLSRTGNVGAEPPQATPIPTRAPFAFGVSFLTPEGQVGTVYRGTPDDASASVSGQPDELAAETLSLINDTRQAAGLSSLLVSEGLAEAARELAVELLSNGAFQHHSDDGDWPMDRAAQHGHPSAYLGENLAVGYATPRETVDAWLADDGSRANLLDVRFTHAGLAFVHDGPWHNYWVLVLSDPPPYQPGRVLVRFQPTVVAASIRDVLDRVNASSLGKIGSLNVERLAVPMGQEKTAVEALRQNPVVAFAELDHRVQVTVDPNDPYYDTDKWWWQLIQAAHAWEVTTGDDFIVIAVVDTGVDLDHPDLAAKFVPGYDFVNDDEEAEDDYRQGHGTHVAGIAAAVTDNDLGVAGMSWGARIMPLKVIAADGYGTDSDVAEAIAYAADHGVKIVNLSLGDDEPSNTMAAATDYAHDKGVFVAAAAGNDAKNELFYPAANEYVVGVAATTRNDIRADFSNFGQHVDVAAPGVAIYSTGVGDSYYYNAGTSMATPFVSGLAALVWSVNPTLTADEVQAIIQGSADDLGDAGWDDYYGWGRINAHRAVSTTERIAGLFIGGRVSTTHGTSAANVTLTISGTGILSTTYTDALGLYFQTGLAEGTYVVVPSQDNTAFVPVSRTVTLGPDHTAGVNFILQDSRVYLPLMTREHRLP